VEEVVVGASLFPDALVASAGAVLDLCRLPQSFFAATTSPIVSRKTRHWLGRIGRPHDPYALARPPAPAVIEEPAEPLIELLPRNGLRLLPRRLLNSQNTPLSLHVSHMRNRDEKR
jgi:hypothetical protein